MTTSSPIGTSWMMVPSTAMPASTTPKSYLRSTGDLDAVDFLGEAVRYTLDLDGVRFVVKSARRRGQERSVGQGLRCTWNPADAVLLPG